MDGNDQEVGRLGVSLPRATNTAVAGSAVRRAVADFAGWVIPRQGIWCHFDTVNGVSRFPRWFDVISRSEQWAEHAVTCVFTVFVPGSIPGSSTIFTTKHQVRALAETPEPLVNRLSTVRAFRL